MVSQQLSFYSIAVLTVIRRTSCNINIATFTHDVSKLPLLVKIYKKKGQIRINQEKVFGKRRQRDEVLIKTMRLLPRGPHGS